MYVVIEIAQKELGYLEKKTNNYLDDKTANAGYNNWTKYARDIDKIGDFFNGSKNGYAWCTSFVCWCFIQAYGIENARKMLYLPRNSLAAGCYYAISYYKAKDQFYKNPKIGDQIFFSDSSGDPAHTGIVSDIKNGRVYTIEGNTSSDEGVVANGGGVWEKSYSLSYNRIIGYGRPDWSIAEEDEDMTGEEIYNKLMDYLKTLDCPDWAKEELQEAKEMGITDGTRPMTFSSRMEAAIMTKRAVKGK